MTNLAYKYLWPFEPQASINIYSISTSDISMEKIDQRRPSQIARPGAKDDDDQDSFSEKSRTSVAGWTNQGCIWLSGQRLYMILALLRTISDFAFCASLLKSLLQKCCSHPTTVWVCGCEEATDNCCLICRSLDKQQLSLDQIKKTVCYLENLDLELGPVQRGHWGVPLERGWMCLVFNGESTHKYLGTIWQSLRGTQLVIRQDLSHIFLKNYVLSWLMAVLPQATFLSLFANSGGHVAKFFPWNESGVTMPLRFKAFKHWAHAPLASPFAQVVHMAALTQFSHTEQDKRNVILCRLHYSPKHCYMREKQT